MQNFYAGTAYRWEIFYIPLALNYNIVYFQPAPLTFGSIEAKNGIGAHLGVGWFINDHFALEFIGRSAMTELNLTNSTGTSKNKGTIASTSLLLRYDY
ncbi:hypothetical protein [Bdellovibrio sp. GT3]|uniref:hypothetical protein n=1 Tax=Bdellovibrio sp. GT3 TaxID=3136282 RepID=UPI0030F195F9